jgi:hypothetical protein
MYHNQILTVKITLGSVIARTFKAVFLHTFRISGIYATKKLYKKT